jgi:predicted nucleic acid-binding protein
MIIVSDTSPITNLIQIGQLELLRQLYQKVIIPPAVYAELAFIESQKELLEKEDWIEPKTLTDQSKMQELLERVDKGEAEAISLAI